MMDLAIQIAPAYSFEMTVQTIREREIWVGVTYGLKDGFIVNLGATTLYSHRPLTAYEWEQIEAETYIHAAQVAAETVEDDRRPSRRLAA